MKLTLAQLFGPNATQTLDTVTILKSDLPGLAPGASHNGQQIYAALLLRAVGNFEGFLTDSNNEPLITNEGERLEFANFSLYPTLQVFKWQVSFRAQFIIYSYVIMIRANASIPYEQPITPDDL